MENHSHFKALIFDFDGLILETEGADLRSWQELYEMYGGRLPFSMWADNIGTEEGPLDPALELEQQIGRKLDWSRLKPQRYARWVELVEAQAALPGVMEYLEEAKKMGFKIGLASCSPMDWLNRHLGRLGMLGYFDVIRGKEYVRVTKPDPAVYLAALEALQVGGEQAIAFEDSPNGVRAAKAAGLFCIVVPNGMTSVLPLDHADLRLNSLSDVSLEKLLRKVNAMTNNPTHTG